LFIPPCIVEKKDKDYNCQLNCRKKSLNKLILYRLQSINRDFTGNEKASAKQRKRQKKPNKVTNLHVVLSACKLPIIKLTVDFISLLVISIYPESTLVIATVKKNKKASRP